MSRVDDPEEATGPDFACVSDGNGWHRFDYNEPVGRTLRPHYNQITCPTTTKSTAEQMAELRRMLAEQDKRRREEREHEKRESARQYELYCYSQQVGAPPADELLIQSVAAILQRMRQS
jgi:hypothetical protein